MKKILLFIFFACANNTFLYSQKRYVDFSSYEGKIVAHNTNNAIDNFISNAFQELNIAVSNSLLSIEEFWDYSRIIFSSNDLQISELQKLMASTVGKFITKIDGSYLSKDVYGNELRLSGSLILPKGKSVKNIIVVNHYTIGSNSECPTEALCFESVLALKGYAVLMPDYIGFGVSQSYIHPYLHTESVAQNVADFILSVRPYLASIGCKVDNPEIIIVGYSQGAAVSLAAANLLELNYANDVSIKKVCVGAGPYDLVATYNHFIKQDYTRIPCVIPMIIGGLNAGDNLKLDVRDFYKEPLRGNYDYWINSKLFSMSEINKKIGSDRVSEILSDVAFQEESESMSLLMLSLKKNSILNISPHYPLFLFHSINDDWVPFINSQNLVDSIDDEKKKSVRTDFNYYGTHMVAGVEFMKKVYEELY